MCREKSIKSVLWILFLMIASGVFAQNPIVIQSVLTPPYPVYYSDVKEMPGLATIIVQNTDLNNSYTLRFRMKLDGRNGVSLLLTQDVIPTNPVKLGPGEVKTLTGEDLAFVYHGIGINDIVMTGIDDVKVLQSQRIPDGYYNLCVQAFDNQTLKPLSGSVPTGCSNKMMISTLEPPEIQSPLNEVEIEHGDPQQILMRWTAVNSSTSAMLYDIRIAEVPEGISPYEAMRTENLLFFEERDYPANVFSYGPSFPALIGGKRYAIQIRAHNAEDNASIRNNGKSDIVTFLYKQANKASPLSFNCSGPCLSPPVPHSKTPLNNLVAGDKVRIGHFYMTILRASKNGVKYRGQAILDVSSFFTLPILLDFNNLMINSNYEVLSGTAIARQKSALSSIGCYQGEDGFVPLSDQDMTEVYNAIIRPNTSITTYMNNASSASVYSGVNLPVGYGNSGKEMAIIGMYFTSRGASMNLVSGYQMSGDASSGNINLIYGINHVCVTPGGPTHGAGTNDVVLLNAVDFHPNANMTVRFEPGNIGANTGCSASISCSGITEFHIRGVVSMNQAAILPEDENGNVIPNKSLGGSFEVVTINPYNWVAPVTFSGTTSLPNVAITPFMRVSELKGHSFHIQKMYYDNSLTSNPVGLRFSANERAALGNSNTWKGLYIKELDMLMPNYFNENDSNRIGVSVRNFKFDENGYSFYANGRNLLTHNQPGTFDEWAFTISNYRVRVVNSELNYCYFRGDIKMDISDAFINYQAQMSVHNSNPMYFLKIEPGEDFFVDMWKARISLDSGTYIRGSVVGENLNAEANISGKLSLNEKIEEIDFIKIKGIKFRNIKAYSHEPYFEGGHFDFVGDGKQKFGGFDIEIDRIAFETMNPDAGIIAKKALSFDFRIDFNDNSHINEFSADAHIKLIGKKVNSSSDWEFDSVQVGRIYMEGEAPLVEVEGTLDWYQNHPVYDNGYRGDVVAYFFNDRSFMVESEMLFGTKNNDTKDSYKYWYVDGAAAWTSYDNPLLSFLSIYGFGGGAYNNMRAYGGYQPMALGVRNDEPDYRPRKEGKGFKALILAASPIDASIFNGVTQGEVDFTGNTVSRFGLSGDYGILRPLPIGEDADYSRPMISARGTIDVHGATDPNRRYMNARLNYRLNIPKNPSMLWGNGLLRYHTGADGWFLRIGDPSISSDPLRGMVNTHIGFDFEMFGNKYSFPVATVHNYFAFGSILPPMPSYPHYVPRSVRNMNINRTNPMHGGSGAVFGIHQNFGMPSKKAFTVLGFGVMFRADAGIGFDLALAHHHNDLCDDVSEFGINKWRAEGQGYFYGIATLEGEILYHPFNITEVILGASMKTFMPNPMYFGAGVSATIGLPVYGSYTFHTAFKSGSSCSYSLDPVYARDMSVAIRDIIKDINLSSSPDNDSVYAYDTERYVEVEMSIPVGRIERYTMADESILKTKVKYQAFIYEKRDDEFTTLLYSTPVKYNTMRTRNDNGAIRIGGSPEKIKIYFSDNLGNAILEPNKRYVVKVVATLMYAFGNGSYREFRDNDDKLVSEAKNIRFMTKQMSVNKISNVVAANPAINQRFFYLGDNTADNAFFLQYSDDAVFDPYGNRSDIKIEFTDLVTDATYSSQATRLINEKKLVYSTPRSTQNILGRRSSLALKKGRIYSVKVYVRAYSETNRGQYSEIYQYYCRTSEYDTFEDKIDDISITYYTVNSSSSTQKYHKLKIKALEGFGTNEFLNFSFVSFNDIYMQKNSWNIQYDNLKAYIQSHNIRMYSVVSEFLPNYSRYQTLGDLCPADIAKAELDNATGVNPIPEYKIRAEYNWNLDKNLYAYWLAKRNYNYAHYGKSKRNRIRSYETSPRIGNAHLLINGSKSITLMFNIRF